ncbi:MAG: DNA mismatch repair protein MutS [Rhodobacterales bacterium CG15_BIG_FIL_POST_REV_8_21_14_020_59_13]|nr:MAG: DNA mismatch repair protein MutS [Rhodobacterales bacterium CG15_BIG_FIL_POST_REV_8_21_14_020_59_13]
MSGRYLKPDERQIWRKVIKNVTPLHPSHKALEAEPFPETVRQDVARSGPPPPKPDARPVAANVKPPPADRSAERRLRRGRVDIDARIDLHGMTQAAARLALGHFLHAARSRGFRSVLVITGKGKAGARNREPGDAPPGVIRRRFPEWLEEPELRHLVSGYASAHRRHGGDGAFYVMIRGI